MKTAFYAATLAAILLAAGCGRVLPSGGLTLETPEIPFYWNRILGEAHWRIEYVDTSGQQAARNLKPREKAVLELPQTWTSAVLAWPYWPERGIHAGMFKPAGALFPNDAETDSNGGGSINASWRGGTDAFLYWELARAASGEPEALRAKVPRLPSSFNWPRFRQLMAEEDIAEEIRSDPWLADWSAIAAKIARNGFDKRRIVIEKRQELALPVEAGLWIGASPFAQPLVFDGSQTPTFPVREATDLWVSEKGALRANSRAWVFWNWGD